MNIPVGPKFGKIYTLYQESEVRKKEQELRQQGIDFHTQYRSSQGMLQVINWSIYTNEETPDLTNFRNRRPGQD
jgi:hypothetical protein